MQRAGRFLVAVSLLICGAALGYVGCSNSGTGTGSGPRASAAETGADTAPPDIKKGVTIEFRPVAASGLTDAHGPWKGKVLEVRGKWLKVVLKGETESQWCNADSFIWYIVKER